MLEPVCKACCNKVRHQCVNAQCHEKLYTSSVDIAGFLSINCGYRGKPFYEDGFLWQPDKYFSTGRTARIYAEPDVIEGTLRYFPDYPINCYGIPVASAGGISHKVQWPVLYDVLSLVCQPRFLQPRFLQPVSCFHVITDLL